MFAGGLASKFALALLKCLLEGLLILLIDTRGRSFGETLLSSGLFWHAFGASSTDSTILLFLMLSCQIDLI